MFLLWLWYMMSWIAAVVMTRLCWRVLPRHRAPLPRRVADGSDSPIAVGWSDRARAMAFKTLPDWLWLRLQTWVAFATANGQALERASDGSSCFFVFFSSPFVTNEELRCFCILSSRSMFLYSTPLRDQD